MEKFTLSKALLLSNGDSLTELSLNFDALCAADFRQIKKLETQIADPSAIELSSLAQVKSLSFEFQLASAFLAAVKGTEALQISDFTRLSMADSLGLAQLANFFWLGVD